MTVGRDIFRPLGVRKDEEEGKGREQPAFGGGGQTGQSIPWQLGVTSSG